MNAFDHSESANAADASPVCPACQSAAVTTTAKRPDVDSYWRCQRCGEVWNIGRRREQQNFRRPWG